MAKIPGLYTPADAEDPILQFKHELEVRVRRTGEVLHWSDAELMLSLRLAYDLASTEPNGLIHLDDYLKDAVWEAFVETSAANPDVPHGTFWGQRSTRFSADVSKWMESAAAGNPGLGQVIDLAERRPHRKTGKKARKAAAIKSTTEAMRRVHGNSAS